MASTTLNEVQCLTGKQPVHCHLGEVIMNQNRQRDVVNRAIAHFYLLLDTKGQFLALTQVQMGHVVH